MQTTTIVIAASQAANTISSGLNTLLSARSSDTDIVVSCADSCATVLRAVQHCREQYMGRIRLLTHDQGSIPAADYNAALPACTAENIVFIDGRKHMTQVIISQAIDSLQTSGAFWCAVDTQPHSPACRVKRRFT